MQKGSLFFFHPHQMAEINVQENRPLLDALKREFRDFDRENVFRLLRIVFPGGDKLFVIPNITKDPYKDAVATAKEYKEQVDDDLKEDYMDSVDFDRWTRFYQKIIFFHPVSRRDYLELIIEHDTKQLLTKEKYFFKPGRLQREEGFHDCIQEEEEEEHNGDMPKISVAKKLADQTLLFLMASGMVFSYNIESGTM